MSENTYADFLASKRRTVHPHGHAVPDSLINQKLFDWQRQVVRWSIGVGRAALFEDCGLGKTIQQLEWARLVVRKTNKPVLILCPIAVAPQTAREAEKFGINCDVRIVADPLQIRKGINLTNYEKLHLFDPSMFAGVVLDESSILKAYTGKTKQALCNAFSKAQYRLACTATPAPNDRMEIGNHSEFLGAMPSREMLAVWFINDTMKAGGYRLRRHAQSDFWDWVASWACCISKPSDLGFSDEGYDLPPLNVYEHVVSASKPPEGFLFHPGGNVAATKVHQEKRAALEDRVEVVAGLVNDPDGIEHDWMIWCDTDYEADALKTAIPEAIEVRGSHSESFKEWSVEWFKGNVCECQLGSGRRSYKLDLCGNLNTQNDAGRSTTPTPMKGSEGESAAEPQSKTGSTCDHTTKQIKRSSKNTPKDTCQKKTEGDASDTPQMPNTESGASTQRSNATSPRGENHGYDQHSESESSSTPQCSNDRAADVQYAEAKTVTKESSSFTSIIATTPIPSAASSAPRAISESASSLTTPSYSSKPLCICGRHRKRRILISKPGIFGFGINFQHCRKTTWFAGYSFAKFYQAIRRLWRFGQLYPVDVHVVMSEAEQSIVEVVKRKSAEHQEMFCEMATQMRAGMMERIRGVRKLRAYSAEEAVRLPGWVKTKHTEETEQVA